MQEIHIREVMSKNPVMVRPEQSVQEAAQLMAEHDCGVLPVGTSHALVGVITDRDIAVRAVAKGANAAKTPVEEVMTRQIIMCAEADTLKHAADLMHKHDVSRIMVMHGGMLAGIVTIADLVRNKGDRREGDKVVHTLLGRKHRQKSQAVPMGTAGAGSEGCDALSEAI